MKECIFPGTFNPFTLGHMDIVRSAQKDFDHIVIAVANINYKENVLPLNTRLEIARKSVANLKNIEVVPFEGMLVDFAREKNIFNFIRGYRNETDLVYEYELREIYVSEESKIDIKYYLSNCSHISASIVRKIAVEGGCLDGLVCNGLGEYIKQLYK